ncbi:MAG: vitamin K epoxide reductase family protein [Bacteroidota bacterium]
MLIWIFMLLAAFGFLVSLYFTLVYYKLMVPDAKFVPSICQLSEETCWTILSTREARVLGVPNFLLGLIYYLGLITLGAFGLIHASTPGFEALMTISLFTVLLGVYLTYSLLSKLRVVCVLCIASHVINVFIAMILYSFWFF